MKRLLAVCIVLLVPAGLQAWEHSLLGPVKWFPQDMPVEYHINPDVDEPDLPGTTERDEVRAGFQAWEDLPDSDVTFSEGPLRSHACSGGSIFALDSTQIVTFGDPCGELDNPTLGLTAVWRNGESMITNGTTFRRIIDSDIVFADGQRFTDNAGAGSGCVNEIDIRGVATHEIGHLIGFGHSSTLAATMYRALGPCDPSRWSLHSDDQEGANFIYPPGGTFCVAEPVASANLDDICEGDEVQLSGAGSGFQGTCDGNPEYRWRGSNGFLQDWSTTRDASDTPTFSTTYEMDMRCSDPFCQGTTLGVNVRVYPALESRPGVEYDLCQGESATLGGRPSAGGGSGSGYSYEWTPTPDDPSMSCTSGAGCHSPFVSPDVTTIYELLVTDSIGCTAVDSTTVTVGESPLADAGADQDTCAGETITLGGSPTASGGTAPYEYVWSSNPFDPTLSCTTCANPDASPTASTTYTVSVSDALDCESADANVTVSVTDLPLPPAIDNTLLLAKALLGGPSSNDDIVASCEDPGGSSIGYAVRRHADSGFPDTGTSLGQAATATVLQLVGEVSAPVSPAFYRAAALNGCLQEGPL